MTAPTTDALRAVRVPGDKSISHRALLVAALADGESRLSGVLTGADCRSTAGALRAMGARIPSLPSDGAAFRVLGVGAGGLRAPDAPLDCGNSGTTARLLLGLLAGGRVPAVLTGDASLRARPMRRVTGPLEAMGARFREEGPLDRLPIRVLPESDFRGGRRVLTVASAQIKSALLLAGLASGRPVEVEEPVRSRDHTERMLRLFGIPIQTELVGGGNAPRSIARIARGPHRIPPFDFHVPGDPSSAAFLVALALLGGAGDGLRVEQVALNPTRTGFLGVLERMGARIEVAVSSGGPVDRSDDAGEGSDERAVEDAGEVSKGDAGSGPGLDHGPSPGHDPAHDDEGREPIGDILARPSELRATVIDGAEIPSLIDEIPILAVLAARARGVTRIRDAQELRVKESDRISAIATNLRRIGVEVTEVPDGLDIVGTDAPLEGRVEVHHDHRIAMAFGILGATSGARIDVSDREIADVSFPGFWPLLEELSGSVPAREPTPSPEPTSAPTPESSAADDASDGASPARGRPPIVTLDGPAGSGKSTTARALAERLGFRHLDSGALYRAVTLSLLDSGRPEPEWDEVTVPELDVFRIRLVPESTGFGVRVGPDDPGDRLRSAEVTARVSRVAAIPAVRSWLLEAQRATAREGGVVADGRDMGTVVFPDAEVKIFLVADLEERARRRLAESGSDAAEASNAPDAVAHEAERLARRDEADAGRAVAPLRPAADAIELDTTHLSFEDQVQRIIELVRARETENQGMHDQG